MLEGVAEAIKLINKSGYLAIIITNQPVIARGEIDEDYLEESWMVGDSKNDILAGSAAGCRTVLIGNDKLTEEGICTDYSYILRMTDKIS